MKKYTIQDITNGNCAVINDGSLEELKLVLRLASPDYVVADNIRGSERVYWMYDNAKYWTCNNHTSLPTQSVKEFLKEPIEITDVKQLRVGDRIKILSKPRSWSSSLSITSPLRDLKFPFELTIEKISNLDDNISMTYGKYGWSLNSIVEAGCLLLPKGVNDTTTTKIRIITSVQAQSIIKIACEGWKNTLIEKWGRQIALEEDIEIEESFYKEMRRVCTTAQHELFDTIFGTLRVCPYSQGELIFVKFNNNLTWELRYATGTLDDDGNVEVFPNQRKTGCTTSVAKHFPTPPNLRLPDYL